MKTLRLFAALFVAFGSLLFATPAQAESLISGQAWEGDVLTLTAPQGEVFTGVSYAFYGDPNNSSCGMDVTSFILMNGQEVVTIDANNNVFGDPCPGVYKTLLVTLISSPLVPVVIVDVPVVIVYPTPDPTPTPVVTQEPLPLPTQTSTPQPTLEPTPQPTTTEEPVAPEPAPVPTPEPSPEPSPEPPLPPEEEPAPAPAPSEEPPVIAEAPEPEPLPAPEPPAAPEEPRAVADLPPSELDPLTLTDSQVEELVAAAEATLETAAPGSAAYEQALEQLAVAAEADDEQLPAELAAIPLLGDAAAAVLDSLNALGNVGADMAPAVREEAEKVIIAAVIATQAALGAVGAATTAAAGAVASSSVSTRKVK